MFDIGFWELLLIAVVTLFVVGPEKMPAFARETALWLSRARSFISRTKREIEQELKLDEQQSFKDKINDLDNLLENAPDKIANTIDPTNAGDN